MALLHLQQRSGAQLLDLFDAYARGRRNLIETCLHVLPQRLDLLCFTSISKAEAAPAVNLIEICLHVLPQRLDLL